MSQAPKTRAGQSSIEHRGNADALDCQVTHWRINGFPATIFLWTSEAFERLPDRPSDAQYYPCGIWCALRLDK